MGQAGRLILPICRSGDAERQNSDLPASLSRVVLDDRAASLEMQNSAQPRRWALWAAFLLVALLALLLRLPQLGARPMHTDEAVNAYIVGQLLAGQPFTYDPQDRHGPALAALALPLARMQGARTFSDLTESELRLDNGPGRNGHDSAFWRGGRNVRLRALPHRRAAVCRRSSARLLRPIFHS